MKPSGGVLGTYTSFGGQAGTHAPASHFSMLRHFPPQSPPAGGAAGAPEATGASDPVEVGAAVGALAAAAEVVVAGAGLDPEEEHASSDPQATSHRSRLTRRTLPRPPRTTLFATRRRGRPGGTDRDGAAERQAVR